MHLPLAAHDVHDIVQSALAAETELAEAEAALAARDAHVKRLEDVLASQLKLLEAIFPRQAIQHMMMRGGLLRSSTASARSLAAAAERSMDPTGRSTLAPTHVSRHATHVGSGPSHGSSQPVAPASGVLAEAAAVATAGEGGAVAQEEGVGPSSGELMVRLATPLATTHRCVTVLFADIVGFTSMCDCLEPLQVMAFLNGLFMRFDSLCDVYGVYKVETIGDCFMVVGGLITFDEDGFKAVRQDGSEDELHAVKVMSFAKAMQREVGGMYMPHDGQPLKLRVGLHSGPVTAGIVGSKMPRFCLFGDTVNTASRMESTCEPGAIHASAATAALLPDEAWVSTGGVQVKGKGEMRTFLWQPQPDGCSALLAESSPLMRCSEPSPPLDTLWSSAGRGGALSDGEVVRQQMELNRRTMAAESVGWTADAGAGAKSGGAIVAGCSEAGFGGGGATSAGAAGAGEQP
ncbi:hypothetical protein GPECTOR_9g700 [Gonium pectorale]|uniref:Guanylate cyclase domain-containing protein n=1 Tax=Gonium pectorale TaxID=33097 RepID=A0A150GS06_GONPE|nr:hypothetical protein GPECTOR_9g700 [Gonium pectorale]|eukprot:KXZ52655.1 hypothetical protein GPECTOR_9g700 [Gonium pectorale]